MFNRGQGEDLIDKAYDLWRDSGEFARTGASQANRFIHRKPLAATLLSVGAGICFGVFFGSLRQTVKSVSRGPRRSAAGMTKKPPRR